MLRILLITPFMFWATSVVAQELSADVQKDMHMLSLAKYLKAKEFENSWKKIQQLKALNVELPKSLDYFEGEAACNTKRFLICDNALKTYIHAHGSNGRYYKRALVLLSDNSDLIQEAHKVQKKKQAEEQRIANFIPLEVQIKNCYLPFKVLIHYQNIDGDWGNKILTGYRNKNNHDYSYRHKEVKISKDSFYYYSAVSYGGKKRIKFEGNDKIIKHGKVQKKCIRWIAVPRKECDFDWEYTKIVNGDLEYCRECSRFKKWKKKYWTKKILTSSSEDLEYHRLTLNCQIPK